MKTRLQAQQYRVSKSLKCPANRRLDLMVAQNREKYLEKTRKNKFFVCLCLFLFFICVLFTYLYRFIHMYVCLFPLVFAAARHMCVLGWLVFSALFSFLLGCFCVLCFLFSAHVPIEFLCWRKRCCSTFLFIFIGVAFVTL